MNGGKRILIVGAGEAGQELCQELSRHFNKSFSVVGFIDDDKFKLGRQIDGKEVLGSLNDLSLVVGRYKIEEVFIAIPSAQGQTIRKIIAECLNLRVMFRIVPRLLEIVQGTVKLQQIREVRLEDLLGRAIIKTEQEVFRKEFTDKKVMVTGGAGSIGSEICRQIAQFKPKKLIIVDWWENGTYELSRELSGILPPERFHGVLANIQEKERIENILAKETPDTIFHAAAFKHVPLTQENPDEAVKNNVFGTLNMMEAALKNNVSKFVFISTDKAADPTSVLGATKLLGEKMVKKYQSISNTKFFAVRFGNVLGSYGSVVPLFQRQIQAGGPVTITDPKMERYFITIPEAVQLVLYTCTLGEDGGIYVLDMGEQVKIEEIARLMIRLAGYIPGEEIALKYIGKRPGEKITEDLIAGDEELIKTENPRVYQVRSLNDRSFSLDEILNQLQITLQTNSSTRIIQVLKSFLPNLEYSV